MFRRDLVSLAAVTVLALTAGIGCDDSKPEVKPAATSTAKPATTAAATAKPTATAAATAAPAAAGNGTIKGVVQLHGQGARDEGPYEAQGRRVLQGQAGPLQRRLVKDGKLQDVLRSPRQRLGQGHLRHLEARHIDQVDCMYTPRIQGVVAGQSIEIKNSDATLHNVHTYKGSESWFNQAQPKGSASMTKESPEDPTVVKFSCDVHPWMRGFVVVTDHPFFAVSGADGSFTIDKVPAGKYKLEAWHTTYGPEDGGRRGGRRQARRGDLLLRRHRGGAGGEQGRAQGPLVIVA
jgi:plastocyanin